MDKQEQAFMRGFLKAASGFNPLFSGDVAKKLEQMVAGAAKAEAPAAAAAPAAMGALGSHAGVQPEMFLPGAGAGKPMDPSIPLGNHSATQMELPGHLGKGPLDRLIGYMGNMGNVKHYKGQGLGAVGAVGAAGLVGRKILHTPLSSEAQSGSPQPTDPGIESTHGASMFDKLMEHVRSHKMGYGLGAAGGLVGGGALAAYLANRGNKKEDGKKENESIPTPPVY